VRAAIIIPDDNLVRQPPRRTAQMKKLMAIALGMALTMTTVVVAFGQDTTKKETTTKKKSKKGTTKT
jgi:hypothetical protein